LSESRQQIAEWIVDSLQQKKEDLQNQFQSTSEPIGYLVIDDLLPANFVKRVHSIFPTTENSEEKKSIRENKYIAYQMNRFDVVLEELIYAFQEPNVVALIAEICEIQHLEADVNLYAGGLSLMKKDNFLNPHLDNSHDKDLNRWRVLNLLYYVTPNWKLEDGGNLELWPKGVKSDPITIVSQFNRLVIMATHQKSWHSVSKVIADDVRCCVSNYYFSPEPLLESDRFHVTTFRGRPEEKSKDIVLRLDGLLRGGLRKIFRGGLGRKNHQYRKEN
jgi:Rps23 Pro-64 3,4-dihydroxylase Tpa1-like proline 4-hydroxylase